MILRTRRNGQRQRFDLQRPSASFASMQLAEDTTIKLNAHRHYEPFFVKVDFLQFVRNATAVIGVGIFFPGGPTVSVSNLEEAPS